MPMLLKPSQESGPQIAESVSTFFAQNRPLIGKLKAAGLRCFTEEVVKTPKILEDTFFSGKTFVVTGSLGDMTRTEASTQIKDSRRESYVQCNRKDRLSHRW